MINHIPLLIARAGGGGEFLGAFYFGVFCFILMLIAGALGAANDWFKARPLLVWNLRSILRSCFLIPESKKRMEEYCELLRRKKENESQRR